jgi:hypothetical protein
METTEIWKAALQLRALRVNLREKQKDARNIPLATVVDTVPVYC